MFLSSYCRKGTNEFRLAVLVAFVRKEMHKKNVNVVRADLRLRSYPTNVNVNDARALLLHCTHNF